MASPFLPSKRPYEHGNFETGRKVKWQKKAHGSANQSQSKNSPGFFGFRVLCPSSKSGSVIGKGGGIITNIRQESGAKVRLAEPVPGCDERLIVISVHEKNAETSTEQHKENDDTTGNTAEGDTVKGSKENEEETIDTPIEESSKSETAKSSIMKALLLVFERLIESEAESAGEDEVDKKTSSVSIRLLVLSSQVGCLLGKGGSKVKQMSADSGALIRILPRDTLPLCASIQDEIVQITGGIESVRKALEAVSQQLLDNLSRDRDSFSTSNLTGPSSKTFVPRQEGHQSGNFHHPIQVPPFSLGILDAPDYHPRIGPPFPQFFEGGPPGQPPVAQEMLFFRLLCSDDKVGSVIGKGGSIVKNLQHETGCEIKVLETPLGPEDRVIVVSGSAFPSDMIAPVQNAVLRVQQRIVMAVPDSKESIARLLVASNQIGCLIGKGGSIISEMRKQSGAHIRILAKDQIPEGVHENDKIIQVTGEFEVVQEALLQITDRLKHHAFHDKLSNAYPAFVDQVPPFGSFMGRGKPSPSRLFPNMPPFNDPTGHPFDEISAFPPIHGSGARDMERLGPWPPQGMREARGPGFFPDYPSGASQRRLGGFTGGPPVITHTSVDVVVPISTIPSLCGDGGGCLRRIREISEAKIIVTESRPEATETVIKISGTPEQTNAAQSLLQAFVLSETDAS